MNLLDAIKQSMEKTNNVLNRQQNNFNDEREWRLARNEHGEGSAIVRFMPQKNPSEASILNVFEHELWVNNVATGKKRVFKALSPANIGGTDIILKIKDELKSVGTEEGNKYAQMISPFTRRIVNVYIKSDDGNKDNIGKVFYYKAPKAIIIKINEKMNPDPKLVKQGLVKPFYPFFPMESMDFYIKAEGKGRNTNYEKSTFIGELSPLFEGWSEDQYAEFIHNNCHDLNEIFLDPSKYKSETEMLKDFHRTISGSEIERYLLEIGSKYITEPYPEDSNPNLRLFGGKANATVHDMASQQTQPEVKSQPQVQSQPQPQPSVAPKQEKPNLVQEAMKEDSPPFDVEEPIEMDDIDSLLDDL